MRALRAQPDPTPTPYPEARRARLPAQPEALSYVNDPAEDRARVGTGGRWVAAESEVGRQVRAKGRKKTHFRMTKISGKTGGAGAGEVGPLRVTYRSTRSNIPSTPRSWRRTLGAPGGAVLRQTWCVAGGMYAPCGASVPGTSVPGRGRGGRSSPSPSHLPPQPVSQQPTSARTCVTSK